MCKCVRVYWEEVYGGLGFEVVVLKWVVNGFDGNGFVRVVLELMVL